MNSYTWDTKIIEQKLNKLEKRTEIDKTSELDIITLNEMLGKCSEDSYFGFTPLQNVEMKKIQPFFVKLASKFYKSYLFKGIEIPSVKFIDLNNDDILSLVHDFYKTRSSTFFNCFLNAYNKRDVNLQIKSNPYKNYAVTYHLLSEKESYINLGKANTIFDLISLVHEYGHVITFLMNPNFITNPNFIFIRELDGLFFEIQFLDFLIENNIFKEEAILANLDINAQMNRKARFIQANDFNLYNMVYFFSYLASIELLMNKCRYPEEILEKIIRENPKSLSEGIGALTPYVTLNESTENFQKKLKKQLDKNFPH